MEFQFKIPAKLVETAVTIPEFFVFKNQSKGSVQVNIIKSKKRSSISTLSTERSGKYAVKTSFNQSKVDFQSNKTECNLKNVDDLKDEPYVNNINIYVNFLKF